MLVLLVPCAFIGMAMAQGTCVTANPSLNLPSCTENCFRTNGCAGSNCPCPDNLKGWCEVSDGEGPSSWFSRWGFCVVKDCPDDGDLTDLMTIYTAQCVGTVGGPLTNDSVPLPLRDWMPKNTFKSTATSASTAGRLGSQSVATSTGITSTGATIPVFTSRSSGTTTSTVASTVTVLDDEASSSSRATSTASSAPAIHDDPRPPLNVAAIIGVAVGGTVLLALIIGLAVFFLRRRKRKDPVRSVSPPIYEPAGRKDMYEKPELDGQDLGYQYSKTGMAAPVHVPVMYAELDTGSPINSVRELEGPIRSGSP